MEFSFKTNGFALLTSSTGGGVSLVPLSLCKRLRPKFELGSRALIPDWQNYEKERIKLARENREREREVSSLDTQTP